MKCRNSAFIAQGSRIIIVVVHVGAVKIYVVPVQEHERGHETQFATKLVEKLVWVQVISFCKISFLVKHLMPNYSKNYLLELVK
jgi:hypothetical protein